MSACARATGSRWRAGAIALLAWTLACRGDGPADESARASDERAAEPSGAPPELTAAQREAIAQAAARSSIKSDEEVMLFPTAAWLDEGAATWRVPIAGWIFEPEEGDPLRAGIVAGLREALGSDPRVRTELFASRVRPFVADNERGKVVQVTLAGEVITLAPSDHGGHFSGQAAIADAIATRWGHLRIEAITRPSDARSFAADVHLVGPEGLFIISDVDDTVKITNVLDKKELLANTFLEPFRAVEGMAELYRGWLAAAPNGHLHFVSSSPWQLYPPLASLFAEAGFPAATYSLKTIRLKSPSVADLFADPLTTKPPAIAELMDRWPRRTFVLVGDSGEKDPEVYGDIARRYPDRVAYIAIRNVTGEDASAPRYAAAFEGVTAPWEIFVEPSALTGPPAAKLPPT